MTYQVLFSLKEKDKKTEVSLAPNFCLALKVVIITNLGQRQKSA